MFHRYEDHFSELPLPALYLRPRQFWVPRAYCNVGGGYDDDQQIAAMAWMADQLRSIGVKFSKTEMSRIFRAMPVSSRMKQDGTPVSGYAVP